MAARSVFYPPADTHTQRFDDDHPGITFRNGISVLVLHTEETAGGWPGYSSGAAAPNMSCLPDMRAKVLRCRGHFPATMSARALVNSPGGVLTNTEDVGVYQIELAGTCSTHMVELYAERGLRKNVDYIFWPEAPDWALREVAKVIAWLHVDWDLPLIAVAPALWTDADRGRDTRMTFGQWIRFRGVCGHQQVPENSHRDPGGIDIDKLMRFAVEEVAKLRPPAPPVKGRTVVVKKGQTLIGIAAAAGITLAALLTLNPSIHDPSHITPGQTITVSAGPTPTPKPTPKPAPKPTPKPTPPKPTPPKPTPPKPTPPKPTPRVRATVQLGSHGPLVRIVQRAVHAKADGAFGPKTQAAVKAFQRKRHLVADGVVGPKTWAAISA